jgi:hypothetical protein
MTTVEPRKRLDGHVPRTGEKRDIKKPEGNRLLGRPRRRWVCTNITCIKKTRYRAWIELM